MSVARLRPFDLMQLHRNALALKAQQSLSAVALKTNHNQMRVLPTGGNEEFHVGILLWK